MRRFLQASSLDALLIAGPDSASGQLQGDTPAEPGQTFTGRVVEVTAGHTYDVCRSIGGEVTIRLHRVDAPESAQSYGRAATRAVRYITEKKNARVAVREAVTIRPPHWHRPVVGCNKVL